MVIQSKAYGLEIYLYRNDFWPKFNSGLFHVGKLWSGINSTISCPNIHKVLKLHKGIGMMCQLFGSY